MKYDDLNPKLRAFLEEVDVRLAKCAKPASLLLRHGALTTERFEVIAKQGGDLEELNRLRHSFGMVALPHHANVKELATDATYSDHVSPCQAAKVVIIQNAGRVQIEPADMREWQGILSDTLAAHPEVVNPAPLYFRLLPAKTSIKKTDEGK